MNILETIFTRARAMTPARTFFSVLLSGVLFAAAIPLAAQSSGPLRSEHVQATLISASSTIKPGEDLQLGLLLRHDRKWHTYWINPGDAGMPTRIDWTLPAGFKAGEFQWPYPERISAPPLMSFGYSGEIILPVKVSVPASARPGSVLDIGAHAKWLECADICIPGQARFQLKIPVGESTTPSKRWAAKIAAAKNKLPPAAQSAEVRASIDAKHVLLRVTAPAAAPEFSGLKTAKAFFVPKQKELISYAEAQKINREGNTITIRLTRDPNGEVVPERFSGVLLTGNSKHPALELGAKLRKVSSVGAAGSAPADEDGPTLLTALLFSLLGGLILNLMPCVLPVLSLKILGFVNKSGESRGKILAHGGMYSLGVLVSFWVLASVMLALRAGGTSLGWGFQLQSPLFVSALAAFIFLFALNQLGVFEIGSSLTRLGSISTSGAAAAGDPTQSDGGRMSGSFMAGILAVVVATPCTAPFMGSALGFALARPAFDALLIFTFLGVGLALPYVLLSAFPGLLRFLPKPGPWMESLKHFMGFLLLATAVWLLWVLGRLAGVDILAAMLGVLVLIGIGAWILGRWTTPTRKPGIRLAARGAALVILLVSGALAYGAVQALPVKNLGEKKVSGDWEKFSPARVAQLRKQGTPVFIDFTADWCLSCKANKAVALNADSVRNKFRELGVVTLRADWTRRDEVITRTLREFNRAGVPLYLLYGRNPSAKPLILPELLTPDIVLNALEKIGPARAAADVK